MLMTGKQLSLDSRIDLVQRVFRGDIENATNSTEGADDVPSDIEEASEGKKKTASLLFLSLKKN